MRRAALLTCLAFIVLAPAASAQAPERIPRSIGMQGFGEFRVSNKLVPATVSSLRFRQLVKTSAQRWGLRSRGRTSRLAGGRDGIDAVGFDTALPSGTLAIQQDFIMRVYKRRQRCRYRGKVKLGCKALRPVYVGERVVERDITVDPRLPWAAGPGKPGPDQYDLETVLIHELGHMAGNKDHVAPCTNSPLWEALDVGEWWRSPTDWYGKSCGQPTPPTAGGPPALRAGIARRGAASHRFGHRRTVVGRVVLG